MPTYFWNPGVMKPGDDLCYAIEHNGGNTVQGLRALGDSYSAAAEECRRLAARLETVPGAAMDGGACCVNLYTETALDDETCKELRLQRFDEDEDEDIIDELDSSDSEQE